MAPSSSSWLESYRIKFDVLSGVRIRCRIEAFEARATVGGGIVFAVADATEFG
jgi:hypothetical protein